MTKREKSLYYIIEHDMMQFIKKTNDTNSIELKRLQ